MVHRSRWTTVQKHSHAAPVNGILLTLDRQLIPLQGIQRLHAKLPGNSSQLLGFLIVPKRAEQTEDPLL